MSTDIQLTKHFKLSEFISSDTASRLHIDNTPSLEVVTNLQQLCFHVLEPMRNWFDVPITISSGYRSPALNKAVGGVPNSQHLTGQAADIHLPSIDVGKEWFNWIKDNLDFDQLIFEQSIPDHASRISNRSSTTWIHVSWNGSRNRHQVKYLTKK